MPNPLFFMPMNAINYKKNNFLKNKEIPLVLNISKKKRKNQEKKQKNKKKCNFKNGNILEHKI